MNKDRRAILSLIAMGRISPREGERLLVAMPDGDEATLKLAVCIAVAWVALPELHGLLGGIGHTFKALLPGLLANLHHAYAFITFGIGGIL